MMASDLTEIALNTTGGNPRMEHTAAQIDRRRGYRLHAREHEPLDGPWQCQPDPLDQGEALGFHLPTFDVGGGWFNLPGRRAWRTVHLPCRDRECGPDMVEYQGAVWFRRDWEPPASWAGRRIVLRSGGAEGDTRAWLNGRPVAGTIDARGVWEADIAAFVVCGDRNSVVVRVDNRPSRADAEHVRTPGRPLFRFGSHTTSRFHIADCRVLHAQSGGLCGQLRLAVSVANNDGVPAAGRVFAEVVGADGEMHTCLLAETGDVAPGSSAEVILEGVVPDAISWSPQNPVEYAARVFLLDGAARVDTVDVCLQFADAADGSPDGRRSLAESDEVGRAWRELAARLQDVRQSVDLSGTWWCRPARASEDDDAIPDSAPSVAGIGGWREVRVPSTYDAAGPDMRLLEGQVWYRRSVHVPREWRGRAVTLRLDGVHWRADIWVNGVHVRDHPDGLLGLDLDITPQVRFGSDNDFVIRTDNTNRTGDRSPGNLLGYFTDGGITREIALIAHDDLCIDRVSLLEAVPTLGGGDLHLSVGLSRAPSRSAGSVQVDIHDLRGSVVASLPPQPIQLGGPATVEIRGTVAGAAAWRPDNPALYLARITLEDESGVRDRALLRLGFRSIEVSENRVLLNGSPIFLYGTDLHEDSHRTGMAVDLETLRRDLREMRRAGINFVRLAHAPRGPSALDVFDECGMMVLAENNLHWWMRDWTPYLDAPQEHDIGPGHPRFEGTVAAVRRQLPRMIERDRHHPSIIMWSVGNENCVDKPGVQEHLTEFLQTARRLDPTRPSVHVSCHYYQGLDDFSHDDIICINGYLGDGAQWRTHIDRLAAAYPGKPILVTEFGFVGVLGEHEQTVTIERQFTEGMVHPRVCGACVYSWVDVPVQEWEEASPLVNAAYGIASRWREKREAVAAVIRMFADHRAREQEECNG